MRPLIALVALLLLAGCTGRDAADGMAADGVAQDGRTSVDAEDVVPGAQALLVTSSHSGTLEWGVRPPLGVATSGPHERGEGTVVQIDVSADVTALLLELVWEDGEMGRADLVLRSIGASDAYAYGSGAGTPEAPARLVIEHPEASYEVTAIADLVEYDVDWTLYVTEAHGGPIPDGHTGIPA